MVVPIMITGRLSSRTVSSAQQPCSLLFLIVSIFSLACGVGCLDASITDNSCTFKTKGKLFTLAMLNQYNSGKFYSKTIDNNTEVTFNFCDPFIPPACNNNISYAQQQKAYTFVLRKDPIKQYVECYPYSSDSKTNYFSGIYTSANGQNMLNLTLTAKPNQLEPLKSTQFILSCDATSTTDISNIKVNASQMDRLIIQGTSPYACPVFSLGSIWKALTDNSFIFGVVLFVVGFIMLFFGILMTHLMIFIAAYFLSFAVLMGVATAFLTPDSSTVAIYFALLFILFLATLIAYALTRLVKVSIFFIGAFFGFVLAALVNTVFSALTKVYSVWSLVFFQVIFTIPLGLLTFKYSEQVIVTSTSVVGAYMIVRPISWIFGGFPNEFTLYLMIEDGQLKTLPWTFFLYLVFIIAIAILGAFYQILKIKRRRPNKQIQTNFITENVEEHIDRIKQAVENIITKYAPDSKMEEDYKKMKEMEDVGTPNGLQNYEIKFEQAPKKASQRNSKEEIF